MKSVLEKYSPGTYKFFANFFEAMTSDKKGHSLRKWLAVGFFWIFAEITLTKTTPETLVPVLGVIASMITALVITWTVNSIQEKKIDTLSNKPNQDEEPKI